MKSRIVVIVLGVLPACAGTALAATPAPPSPARQRAAVARAMRSPGLWATVNICDTKLHPNTVGIRAQMPSLGFAARLRMTVRLGYYTTATDSFKPLPGGTTSVDLGTVSNGFQQAGVTFTVKPPATLNATVTFSWSLPSKLLGSTARATTAGRKGVRQGDPAGYSADVCRVR